MALLPAFLLLIGEGLDVRITAVARVVTKKYALKTWPVIESNTIARVSPIQSMSISLPGSRSICILTF